MNDKNKKVVTVSTKKEVVVQKPKVEDFDVSKSLDEHMKENQENVKTRLDYKTIFTYVIMVIIVVAGVLLLVHFCEKSIDSLNKNTTTQNFNYQFISTTTTTNNSVEYVRPSTVPTAATHTVFVGNKTNSPSTKVPDRTNDVQIKTTKSTTTSSTTITTTTTSTDVTEPTTESTEDVDDNEDSENRDEVGEN